MPRQAQYATGKQSPHWPEYLGRLALLLAIAVTLARCTFLESLRDAFGASPGSEAVPAGPGAAVSLWLDLLCLLPALLVLVRRIIDPAYRLRSTWPMLAAVPLGVWMLASAHWADDKFACIIMAAHFCAALAILWAASQLVDRWFRLRLVAAASVGLFSAYLFQGFYYRFSEAPALQQTYQEQRQEILRQRGWKPTDFVAIQFENKIKNAEVMGFSASTNSFGSLLVLVMVITAGLAIQRFTDGDDPPWGIALCIFVALGLWLLLYTKSKAAVASPALAAVLLVSAWGFGPVLVRHARGAFFAGVAIVLLISAAVIGHGLVRHKLPTASLNFRWRYWVASWPLFWQHPLLGVGWSNFSRHYLHFRLPQASEEIQDPHNFLVRFFAELGMVGGLLAVAWMLSLWYALTRPKLPSGDTEPALMLDSASPASGQALAGILAIAAVAVGINILASVDCNQIFAYVTVEIMKRGAILCLVFTGLLLGTMRDLQHAMLDNRPAPWVLRAIIVALAVFLIHNLIEFSLFEPGATCLFCLLAGSAMDIRQSAQPRDRKRNHLFALVETLAVVMALALLAMIQLVIPVTVAEAHASDGDEALRKSNLEVAAADYRLAWQAVPYNADYIFRAGRALLFLPQFRDQAGQLEALPAHWQQPILEAFNKAIAIDKSVPTYFLQRAYVEALLKDDSAADADYRAALDIDPNDVAMRLDYAGLLLKQNQPSAARRQMELALQYNDGLDEAEPKRLPKEKVAQIEKQINQLPAWSP